MLFDGIEFLEGSEVVNFTLPKGTTFPSSPDQGELFYKTDNNKPYIYVDTSWIEMSTGSPYDIGITATGNVALGSTIVFFVTARSFTIPQNFIGSQAVIGTNNGDATFTIYKNGTSIGTVSFTNSSTVGSFTSATSVNFVAGDTLSVDSPSENSPSNLAITIKSII